MRAPLAVTGAQVLTYEVMKVTDFFPQMLENNHKHDEMDFPSGLNHLSSTQSERKEGEVAPPAGPVEDVLCKCGSVQTDG